MSAEMNDEMNVVHMQQQENMPLDAGDPLLVALILDEKCKTIFNLLADIIVPISNALHSNPAQIQEMCDSVNNSIPIGDFMEQITSDELSKFFQNSEFTSEVYMSGQEGRTDHDRLLIKDGVPYARLGLDNKGVKVKKIKKDYTLEILKSKLGHPPDLSGIHTWVPMINYIRDHNLLNIIDGEIYKNKVRYETELYSESDRDNDHPDPNFHMKCSQSNLHGFTGKINKGIVTYSGKIPSCVELPHFTFILKHIFSRDHGIHKLVLISVPHCSIQPIHYEDIQLMGVKRRMAKAKDEFRFNMDDIDGNPYTFLGTDIPRYKVFDILPGIQYGQ